MSTLKDVGSIGSSTFDRLAAACTTVRKADSTFRPVLAETCGEERARAKKSDKATKR